MSGAPYHVVCPRCGSPNVTCDAVARWDFELQDWTLSAAYDDRTCDDCGLEGHSFNAVTEADLTPAQRAVIVDFEDYVEPAK